MSTDAEGATDNNNKSMSTSSDAEIDEKPKLEKIHSVREPSYEEVKKGTNILKKYFPLRKHVLAKYQRLATEEQVLKRSINASTFAAFCIALNIKILQPNYAIMATPGGHPESFENTDPFDFNSATYFIPMTSMLGVAIASTVTGTLSDRKGRKPILLFCTIGCGVGGIVKYIARRTFWGFCIANFLTGILSGGLPVALGYVGDVYVTNEEKQDGFALLVSYWMFGQSFGGIIAILLQATGLFAPLIIGSIFLFISAYIVMKYMVEAGEVEFLAIKKAEFEEAGGDGDDGVEYPEEIDKLAMQNIVWGSFFDNVGSQALFPLCLSPLAYEQYYLNFVNAGEEPIMSLNGYKWLSALVSLMVIPSANLSPKLFAKIGAAASCVFGNTMTAIVTICLLYIGSGAPTEAMFGLFVAVMYLGFPFTVISQLTTSPMLDIISPLDKRGYVQGINSTVMNIATAVAPWLLGLLADAIGTFGAIWTGIGISFFAALANSPLILRKGFGPQPKKVPPHSKAMPGEDDELVKRILAEDHTVTPQEINQVNIMRREKGLPYLVVHPRPYSEDKDSLDDIKKEAESSFLFWRDVLDDYLERYNKDENVDVFISQLNTSRKHAVEDKDGDVYKEIGEWFGEYLKDSGYIIHTQPVLIKQLIMSAFPVLMKEKEINEANFERYVLYNRRLMDQYAQIKKERTKYSLHKVLGQQGPNIYG